MNKDLKNINVLQDGSVKVGKALYLIYEVYPITIINFNIDDYNRLSIKLKQFFKRLNTNIKILTVNIGKDDHIINDDNYKDYINEYNNFLNSKCRNLSRYFIIIDIKKNNLNVDIISNEISELIKINCYSRIINDSKEIEKLFYSLIRMD